MILRRKWWIGLYILILALLVAALVASFVGVSPALALTATLQPDSAGFDTYLNTNAPTADNGAASEIVVGENNANTALRRSLIKFDLSSIPSNAIVSSVTLSLWVSLDASDNSRAYNLFRVTRNWTEVANWNTYDGTNEWTGHGVSHDPNDYDGSVIWAQTTMGASESVGTEKQWSIDTSLFTEFLDGGYNNYGWVIRAATESNDGYNFHSSDSATAAMRPKLVVNYTVPTATPTHTHTLTPSLTPSITLTPSLTPSITLTPTLTPEDTATPSETPSPTATPTETPDPPEDVEFDFWLRYIFGMMFLAFGMYWHGLFFFYILPYLLAYNQYVAGIVTLTLIGFGLMQFFRSAAGLGGGRDI